MRGSAGRGRITLGVAALLLALAAISCGGNESARPCADGQAACEPRDVSGVNLFGSQGGAAAFTPQETPTIEETLEKGLRLAEASPVQIALRGTAAADSVRCDWRGVARTLDQREEAIRFWLELDEDAALPSAAEVERRFLAELAPTDSFAPALPETAKANFLALARGGETNDYMFLTCFADYAVHEYMVGSGPTRITIAYDRMGETRSYGLYVRAHAAGEFGSAPLLTASQSQLSLERMIADAVSGLTDAIGRRESIVLLAPMGAHNAISVEAWQAVEQWDLQRAADGTVSAVRYGVPQGDPEYSLPYADLKRRVATAAGSDAFAGKRIANASGITQYYRDIGAYGDITPGDGETATFTPAQPPPRCGSAVANHASKPRPRPSCFALPPPRCGSAVANHAANPGLVQDCMALLAAKDELRGTRALNWSESRAIADWDGVKTTGTPARVTQVRLVARRFTGTIPPSLGKLPALTRLFLNGNELTGTIPPSLGDLAALEQLRLNDNDLTGALPAELGELANLRELWISDNDLTGAIPSELGSLSKLEVLSLLNNGLTGSVPSELGSLSKLTQLSLSNNALTGSIPTELTNLRSLAWLRLGGNALTGCVPSSLRSVADHDLHRLRGFSDC